MPKTKPDTTKRTFALFWEHISRYPQYFWPLLLIVPASVVVGDFLQPYITSQILNRLSTGQYDPHHLWASFSTQLLLFAAAGISTRMLAWRFITWLVWNLEANVVRDLSQRMFSHLTALSAGFHANRFAGSLVSQANKLTSSYVRLMDSTVFNLYTLIISTVATIVLLWPRSPLYVVVLVGLTVAYVAGAFFFSKRVRRVNIIESGLQSRQTGYLADSLSNIAAIKTFSAGALEERRFGRASEEVRRAGLNTMRATLNRAGYASLFTTSIGIVALFIAVIGVGVLRADIGTVFLMVSYTTSLSQRLWEFQNVLRQYNRAMGDASDMVEILDIEPGIQDPATPEDSRMSQGAIEFQDMEFTHDESDGALFRDFNLAINPGEKIGLVGHSGSGKTTLTKLLLRFSDLDGGRITIDGQDITSVTQDDLRRAISYVPQEPLLFHRTLSENIAYGQPGASDAEIIEAARRAHAHDFITGLPHGYDTLVGERGVKLSGGQRQRIAIARAMIKSAPILVLDEATSALDSESEKLIQDALWRLMEGRTAIVIAHRLSTIQRMDRIVVLDEGAIVEQGTHAQLLRKRGGVYAKLWSHQSGGFIDEE